jgi:hypothetical protein
VLGGLPEPRVNHILRELNGDWAQRLDLCYPELKVIVEYDGRHHSEVRANWLHDIKRREALEREGWRHVPNVGTRCPMVPEWLTSEPHSCCGC